MSSPQKGRDLSWKRILWDTRIIPLPLPDPLSTVAKNVDLTVNLKRTVYRYDDDWRAI